MEISKSKSLIQVKEEDYKFLYNPSDPLAIVNMVPLSLSNAIRALPRQFLEMSKEELEQGLRLSKTDRAFRKSFWREYNRSAMLGETVNLRDTCRGVCCFSYTKALRNNSRKVAWLIKRDMDDELMMSLLYERSMERLDEILESDITKANGTLDPSKANVVLKAIQMIENRVKGMATQRTESKHLKVSIEERADGSETREETIERIREKLGKLEQSQQRTVGTA